MQWHDESTAWRNKVEKAVTTEMETVNRAAENVSLVQIGEFSDKDLDSAFSLDWAQIRVPSSSTASGPGIETVKKQMRQIYNELSKVFIYYAGYGQGT